MFFTSLCFFLVILHSDEGLSDGPKGRKTVMCLTEGICVCELCSGMSYSALYGTSVNESTLYLKQEHP